MPNRRSSKFLKPEAVAKHESLKTKILRRVNEENASAAPRSTTSTTRLEGPRDQTYGHQKSSSKLVCDSTSDSILDRSSPGNTRLSSLRRSKSSVKQNYMDSERMHRKCKSKALLREYYHSQNQARGERKGKRNRSMRSYKEKVPSRHAQGGEESVQGHVPRVSSDTMAESKGSGKSIKRRLRSATSLTQKSERPTEVSFGEPSGSELKIEEMPKVTSPVASLLERQMQVPDSPCRLVIIENATTSSTNTELTGTFAETHSSKETSSSRSKTSKSFRQARKRKLKMTDDGLSSVLLKKKQHDKQTQTTRSSLAGVAENGTADKTKVPQKTLTSVDRDGPIISARQVLNQQFEKNLAGNEGQNSDIKMTPTAFSSSQLTQTTVAQCMTLINQGTLKVMQSSSTVVPLYTTGLMVTKSAATEAAKALAGRNTTAQGLGTQPGSSNQTAVHSPPMSATSSLTSVCIPKGVNNRCVLQPSETANVLELESINRVVTLPFSISGSVVQPSPTATFISTTATGQCKPSVVAAETRKLSTAPALRYEMISSVPACEKNNARMSSVSTGNVISLDENDENATKECQIQRQSQPVVQVIAPDGGSSLTPVTLTQTGLPELANGTEGPSVTRSSLDALEAPGIPPNKTYITLETISNATKDKALQSTGSLENQPSMSTSTLPSARDKEEELVSENGEKIKRPMNAFMIWSREQRAILARENPNMTNADISVRLGNMWNDLDYDLKQTFFDEANRLKLQHRKDHPGWVYQPRPIKRRRRRQSFAPGYTVQQPCSQLLLVLPDGKQIVCPAAPVPRVQQGAEPGNAMMNQMAAMNATSSTALRPALHNTQPDVKVFQQAQPKPMGDSLVMNSQTPQNQGGFMYLTPLSSRQVNASQHPQPLGPQLQVLRPGTHLFQQGADVLPVQSILQTSHPQTLGCPLVQSQTVGITDKEKPSANQSSVEPPKISPNTNQCVLISPPADIGSSLQRPQQMNKEQHEKDNSQQAQGSDGASKNKGKGQGDNDQSAVASSQGAKLVTLSSINQMVTLPFTIDKSFVQGPPLSTGSTQLITLLTSHDSMTTPSNSCQIPLLSTPFPAAQPPAVIPGSAMDMTSAQSGLKAEPRIPSSQDLQIAPTQGTVIDLTVLGPSNSPHGASPAACPSLTKLHSPGESSPCIGMHVAQAAGSPAPRQMSAPERLLASLAMSGVDVCGDDESEKLFDRVMNI